MAVDGAGTPGTQEETSGVEQAKEQAREQVGSVAGRVQETARTQVDQRSTQAGERANSLAGDLRSVSEQLRGQGNDQGAQVTDQVAERVDRAGSYLSDADADTLLSDIEDLGRRQPWLVLAGGVALGVAAARLLKASSSQRYQTRSRIQRPSPAGGGEMPSTGSGFDSSGFGTPSTQSLASGQPAAAPADAVGAGYERQP